MGHLSYKKQTVYETLIRSYSQGIAKSNLQKFQVFLVKLCIVWTLKLVEKGGFKLLLGCLLNKR